MVLLELLDEAFGHALGPTVGKFERQIHGLAEAIDQGHIVGQQVLHHLVRLRYGRVLLQRAFLQVLRVGAQRSGSEHPDPFRDQVDVRLCLGVLQLELFVDIEEVAEHSPEKILHEPIDPGYGLFGFQATRLAFELGLEGPAIRSAAKFLPQICRFFIDNDCSMAELNPLVVTGDGQMLALDAKVTFDENAMFRHKDFLELRDLHEEEEAEVQAASAGLSYVKLDGNIGCLVNGAGLAMSTMDLIKLHGAEPANFLDVGGGASVDQVTEAFRIILADPNVKAILVNIFGGIMKCDTIVEALLTAYDKIGITVPLVVRLEGTNVKIAREMLQASGKQIITADDLTDAAKKVVATLGA